MSQQAVNLNCLGSSSRTVSFRGRVTWAEPGLAILAKELKPCSLFSVTFLCKVGLEEEARKFYNCRHLNVKFVLKSRMELF